MDNFNLTSFLHGLDPDTRWNSKISYFIKNREDKEKWRKNNNNYIVDSNLACIFLDKVSAKDLKTTKKISNQEDEILQIKNENISIKESQKNINSNWETRGSEFKEFFNFENWEKTNSEIALNFKDLHSIDEIITEIKQVFLMVGYMASYSTIRNRLTDIRNLIKSDTHINNDIKDLILKHLVLPKKINDKLNQRVEKSNIDRIKNRDNITDIKIVNLRRLMLYLEKALSEYAPKHIEHGDKMKIATYSAIYLGIATGRRPSELIKSGSFIEIKNKPNFVLFEGQAKRKNFKSEAYEIPLLFSNYKSIKKTIELLRGTIPTATARASNTQITAKLSAMFRNDWQEIMSKFDLNIGITADKMRNVRSAYAITCERVFNQTSKEKISQAGYMSTILGHLDWDTKTYQSYFRFNALIQRFNLKLFLREFYKNNNLNLKNIEV